MTKSRLTFFSERRPVAMVIGHERSGVHFLMNSLAACYGYVSLPQVDFDRHLFNINYFYPREITKTLLNVVAAKPLANTVKSHHAVDFFDGELPRIAERFVLFYIYRDPVAVLSSYWRFMHKWNWTEGPKLRDPIAFARAEPCGQMMRYQMRQHSCLMTRWAAHVDGWLSAAQEHPWIVPVRYEDLDGSYDDTVRSFESRLGRKPDAVTRPAHNGNYIVARPEHLTAGEGPIDTPALREICQRTVGPTMARCGY